MGNVNVDYSALLVAIRNVKEANESIKSTKVSITHRYQQLGEGWRDRKYLDLGNVIRECLHELLNVEKVLTYGEKALGDLARSIKEYEETSLGGTENNAFETNRYGNPFSRLMSKDEVNTRYQSGLASIDAEIENYKEALMKRGVPDGYWLKTTLAKHKAAMTEQLGYDLDLASGHGQDSTNNSDAYHYPDDYPRFYSQLADEFKKFCLAENNPNYRKGVKDKWSINCQRCVPAYEMQRRGQDVTATPCNAPDNISYNPFSVWQSPDIKNCHGVGNDEIQASMSEWGDGARAQVVVAWTPFEGHTFVAEQVNGQTHYYDPQSGNEEYLDWVDSALPGYTQFCRIDNLQPTGVINNCYTEVQR